MPVRRTRLLARARPSGTEVAKNYVIEPVLYKSTVAVGQGYYTQALEVDLDGGVFRYGFYPWASSGTYELPYSPHFRNTAWQKLNWYYQTGDNQSDALVLHASAGLAIGVWYDSDEMGYALEVFSMSGYVQRLTLAHYDYVSCLVEGQYLHLNDTIWGRTYRAVGGKYEFVAEHAGTADWFCRQSGYVADIELDSDTQMTVYGVRFDGSAWSMQVTLPWQLSAYGIDWTAALARYYPSGDSDGIDVLLFDGGAAQVLMGIRMAVQSIEWITSPIAVTGIYERVQYAYRTRLAPSGLGRMAELRSPWSSEGVRGVHIFARYDGMPVAVVEVGYPTSPGLAVCTYDSNDMMPAVSEMQPVGRYLVAVASTSYEQVASVWDTTTNQLVFEGNVARSDITYIKLPGTDDYLCSSLILRANGTVDVINTESS